MNIYFSLSIQLWMNMYCFHFLLLWIEWQLAWIYKCLCCRIWSLGTYAYERYCSMNSNCS